MDENPKRRSYLRQAWLVIVLALVYGGALAGVETALSARIAENKKRETYDVIPRLVPGADKTKTEEVEIAPADGEPRPVYRVFAADGTHLGWVVPAGGQGFADRIDLLVGLDANASTITGLYVLDQKETPGLGNLIASEELFLDQFAGKSIEGGQSLVVVKGEPAKDSNQIKAVSGATISSESVTTIVNRAVAELKEPIRRRA